jgi:anti-sigma factor RsiW
MNEPQATAELIRQYLDGAAAAADLAELERCLARPECATAFADACRMDAGLRTLLKEESQVLQTRALCTAIDRGRRRGRAWRGVAVAVAISIICFGLWRFLTPPRSPAPVLASNFVPVVQQSPRPTPDSAARTDHSHLAAAIAMLGLVTANTVR